MQGNICEAALWLLCAGLQVGLRGLRAKGGELGMRAALVRLPSQVPWQGLCSVQRPQVSPVLPAAPGYVIMGESPGDKGNR